jgi:hypothetical protein
VPSHQFSVSLAVVSLVALAGAHAQTQWTVESKSSLAWWQIDPHLNHLWATSCPAEPSWRPGEGRSSGYFINRMLRRPANKGDLNISDTVHMPLYPRPEARDLCNDAVTGQVVVPDTVTWNGVRGAIAVKANYVVSGLRQRDEYTHNTILEVGRYPEIRFTIDSLVRVTRQADTLSGSAVGVFSVHGVDKPMVAAVRAWPEAGGLRVLARFSTPAPTLTKDYALSTWALGLGVGTQIWYNLWMGVDLLLRRDAP